MQRRNGAKAPPEIYTSFAFPPALSERLRLARALTNRKQKDLVKVAIEAYLDQLGVPRTLPKLKEPGR